MIVFMSDVIKCEIIFKGKCLGNSKFEVDCIFEFRRDLRLVFKELIFE